MEFEYRVFYGSWKKEKIEVLYSWKNARGDNVLFRKAYKDIKKWFDSTNKNALLIDGAR